MSEWVLVPVEVRRVTEDGPLLYFVTDAILSEPPSIPADVLDAMVERGMAAFLDEYEGGDTRDSIRACLRAALGVVDTTG